MPYINDQKTAEIKNALATILRAPFDTKQATIQENRLLIVRQVGKIGGLLPRVKEESK